MNRIPKPQEIYKHFKGNLYQIITIAEDSEDGRAMVVYQALYGAFKVYVRPLEMFVSKVDKVKYPDVVQEYRFERVQMAEGQQEQDKELSESISGHEDLAGEFVENIQEELMQKEPVHKESTLDPLVWDFLDADSHEKRLNILAALHHRITDDMITTMAVACDVEVPDGDVEERYSQLKNCLIMLDRFEIKRK